MHNLKPLQEGVQIVSNGLVDGGCSQRAAHHHEDRLFLIKPAQIQTSPAVTLEQLVPNRRSGQDRLRIRQSFQRFRKIAANLRSKRNTELIGKSRRHIRLVDNAGNVQSVRSVDYGNADVSAL